MATQAGDVATVLSLMTAGNMSTARRSTRWGLPEIPANSVDIDILIGATGCAGRQIGPAALNLLAQQLLRDPNVPLLGLTSAVANTRAHRAFAKAGFHIARQYQPHGLGPCHLLLRDLRLER